MLVEDRTETVWHGDVAACLCCRDSAACAWRVCATRGGGRRVHAAIQTMAGSSPGAHGRVATRAVQGNS